MYAEIFGIYKHLTLENFKAFQYYIFTLGGNGGPERTEFG